VQLIFILLCDVTDIIITKKNAGSNINAKDDKIRMSYLLNDPVYSKIIANNFNETLLKDKFT